MARTREQTAKRWDAGGTPPTRVRGAGGTPPTRKGIPLIGSALELRRDLLGALERAMREDGDVVRFVAGPPGLRLVCYGVFHPDAVQQVLASKAARYRKDNTFYEELRITGGDGLLTSQDELWLRQKRFIQPLFTHRRIASYVPVMAEETARLIDRWDRVKEGVADIHADMTRLTLRIVGRALFGADVDQAVPIVRQEFPIVGEYVQKRGMSPVRIPRSWPTPANRRAARAQQAVYRICDELIAGRRATPARKTPASRDLLSLLIDARDGDEALSDDEIRDQVLVFLLAGHETTAVTLTFAFSLLGQHLDVQHRARAEAEQVLGGRVPTAEDVPRLRYTTMMLKEAMRLYPAAFVIGRHTPGGDQIGGYQIPPGSDIYVSPWVTHRHPEFWPDPERFDPDRFTADRESERHRYAWFPFGGGPRACIGQYFSMLEAAVVTAMVLQAYELTAPPCTLPLTTKITLRPASAVPCRIAPRRSGASAP